MFQFQAGAIRSRSARCSAARLKLQFQFQAGAIRRPHARNSRSAQNRFNSKLVRLEASTTAAQYVDEIMFQFQAGAIRSAGVIRDDRCQQDSFQFQAGAIRSVRAVCNAFATAIGFNSKLVRLEARVDVTRYDAIAYRFNSKLVRLEGSALHAESLRTMFQFQAGAIRSDRSVSSIEY